jgi:hypothetical protein
LRPTAHRLLTPRDGGVCSLRSLPADTLKQVAVGVARLLAFFFGYALTMRPSRNRTATRYSHAPIVKSALVLLET